MFFHSLILTSGTLLSLGLAAGQRQSVLQPTTAAPTATPLAGGFGYTHVGCWNDTTGYHSNGGARALTGGRHFVKNTMTTSMCLEFCSRGSNGKPLQYAGLEFGRECWCGKQLSDVSDKLNDSSACIYSCDGNSSEICGGTLALTLYNLTAVVDSSKTGIAWSQFSGAAGYGTLAVITLAVAAVL